MADLGGLGAKEGALVGYNWTLPSLVPSLLPWVAILLLLLVKPNRCGKAWWIWLPLACIAALSPLIVPELDLAPSELTNSFIDLITALAFGVAAVWLLAPYLARKHRILTVLCALPALAGFGVFSFAVKQDWNEENALVPWMSLWIAIAALAVALALTLAGVACRRRYRPLGVYLWTAVSLLFIWILVMAPLFFLTAGRDVPVTELIAPLLIVTVITFVTLLPFLILSSANSLFRDRLKALLHLERDATPAVITAAPAPLASRAT